MNPKQVHESISPETIEQGPLPFNLFARDPEGQLRLICRKGDRYTDEHLAVLRKWGRPYFIATVEKDQYLAYVLERLEPVIDRRDVRTVDKADLLCDMALSLYGKLYSGTSDDKAIQQVRKLVRVIVEMVSSGREFRELLFSSAAGAPYEFQHAIDVMLMNLLIGSRLFPEDGNGLDAIALAGFLSDIGKARIDQAVLRKSGRLNAEERDEAQRHVPHGGEILTGLGLPQDIVDASVYHHERWDGRGYPEGLAGERIPLYARITALSDTYCACTSSRVYRSPLSQMLALREMSADRGHFDPRLFNLLLEVVLENASIIRSFRKKEKTESAGEENDTTPEANE